MKRTGPATIKGKATVSRNALRHGGHSAATDALLALLAETRRQCTILISENPNREAARVRDQFQRGKE